MPTLHLPGHHSERFRVGNLSPHLTAPHLAEYILDLHLSSTEDDVTSAAAWLSDCFKQMKLRIDCYLPPLPALQTLGIVSLLATNRIKHLQLECYDLIEDNTGFLPILSPCSTTLEELSLRIYFGTPNWESVPGDQSTVCLGALRKLTLFEESPQLHRTRYIEYPNIESLPISRPDDRPCVVPSSLFELVLKGIVIVVHSTFLLFILLLLSDRCIYCTPLR